MSYVLGTAVPIYATFRRPGEDTVYNPEPDRVALRLKSPSGSVKDVSRSVSAHTSSGYYAVVRPDATGVWKYRWEAQIDGIEGLVIEEGSFEVVDSSF